MIGNPFNLSFPALFALKGLGDQVRHASLISRAGTTGGLCPVRSFNARRLR